MTFTGSVFIVRGWAPIPKKQSYPFNALTDRVDACVVQGGKSYEYTYC